MTIARRALLSAACLALALRGSAEEAPAQPPAPVDETSPRPDFAALRAEWSQREDFVQRCEVDRPMRAAFRHIEKKRWDELLALATPWSERCPVDLDAHVLRAIALEGLGREAEGAEHRIWARGLFEAVLASGDGKTPETAYQVIAVFEEYSMLRMFGWEPKQQSLVGGGIDALKVVAEGEERTVFFDPSASFRRMMRQFGEAEPAP
jgi:hypothetical protein